MGFAIPISSVEDLIKTLISGQNDEEGVSLGIEGYITTSSTYNYNMPTGFYISKIVTGGNADNSELEIGNIITKIDSKSITSLSDLKKVLNSKNKGDKITLTVKYISKSEYVEKEIEITLK
jgi:S1-C subfamily serine protease